MNRPHASVNNVAMRTVKVVYNRMMDIGCFSHTIDLLGERMKTPVLDAFSKGWIGLFSRSPKARLAWHTLTGLSPRSYSATGGEVNSKYFVSSMILLEMFSNFLKVMTHNLLLQTPYSIFSVIPVSQES